MQRVLGAVAAQLRLYFTVGRSVTRARATLFPVAPTRNASVESHFQLISSNRSGQIQNNKNGERQFGAQRLTWRTAVGSDLVMVDPDVVSHIALATCSWSVDFFDPSRLYLRPR